MSDLTATARLDTDRPQRYLKQLMSHLGNRTQTELVDPDHGTVRLGTAHSELTADATGIDMVVTAEGEDDLARIKDVVGRHLLRFTEKEQLTTDWS